MNKTSPIRLVILFCILFISACAGKTQVQDGGKPILERDAVPSYSAEFKIHFNGAKNWGYLLTIRKSPTLREINLHIEGVQGTQNPGDIRMVTDNVTTWMIGNGTDQQCVQFPNGKGMDPTFIYPESLVSLQEIAGKLKLLGEEQLNGLTVLHFRGSGISSGPWNDATIDLSQEKSSEMLRQFSFYASGEDPFFGAGSGQLDARYSANPLDNAEISPVTGCEIGVPLPEAISMFVRLPGLASFESQNSIEELVNFYQANLPGGNWTEKDPPAQSDKGTVLSYQREAEGVEIHIEPNPAGGSLVRLLFIQGQ